VGTPAIAGGALVVPTHARRVAFDHAARRARPADRRRTDRHRIGRDIWIDGTWHERADTRIPPGQAVTFARAWTAGRTA
jgi:hypothetical protein